VAFNVENKRFGLAKMKPYYKDKYGEIYLGDTLTVLKSLETGIVQCVITSPPYWGLRDYKVDGQYGLEKTPEEYIERMVKVFREVKRVMRDDAIMFLNMGDSYWGSGQGRNGDGSIGKISSSKQLSNAGSLWPINVQHKQNCGSYGLKPKDLCGIPWRLALALQADGWYLRSDIIWHKPNPLPESVTDRPTKSHEYIFLMSKKANYFYDATAVREKITVNEDSLKRYKYKVSKSSGRTDGISCPTDICSNYFIKEDEKRNLRDVWTILTQSCSFAHFATFPTALVDKCLMAGTAEKTCVLDPFGGTGTVALRAKELGRRFIHIDLSEKYNEYAKRRLAQEELF